MPIARVQLPDGRIARFEVADGVSPEQVEAIAREQFSGGEMPKEQPGAGEGFVRGVKDPGAGLLQLVGKASEGYQRGMGNILSLGGMAKNPASKAFSGAADLSGKIGNELQTSLQRDEEDYQQRRGTDAGVDWARLGGNLASPVNLLPFKATKIPQSNALKSVIGGAAGAATMPVLEGDFWQEKGKQTGTGAALGYGLSKVGNAVSRVIKPKSSPQVDLLMKEGVTPPPGAIMGGAMQRAEQGMTSVPVLGDSIKRSQTRAIEEFNRAAINRTLAPIGKELPASLKAGNKAIEYADDALGDAYNQLLPRLKVIADPKFTQDVSSLRALAQNLPKSERGQFNQILNNQILGKMSPKGGMTGEQMKGIESELGRLVRGYSSDASFDKRNLGSALRELQASLRGVVERSNPQDAGTLKAINQGWANFTRVRGAAAMQGAKEGVFSPAQLRSAVRSLDASVKKGVFAKGNALMQDLADAGESVLGSKVPDSGTPYRAMANWGLLGGGAALNPMAAGGVLGAAGLYTSPVQKLLAGALLRRPDAAAPIAAGLRNSLPYVAAPYGAASLGLLNQ